MHCGKFPGRSSTVAAGWEALALRFASANALGSHRAASLAAERPAAIRFSGREFNLFSGLQRIFRAIVALRRAETSLLLAARAEHGVPAGSIADRSNSDARAAAFAIW
jgi:hypothetical protein